MPACTQMLKSRDGGVERRLRAELAPCNLVVSRVDDQLNEPPFEQGAVEERLFPLEAEKKGKHDRVMLATLMVRTRFSRSCGMLGRHD